MNKREGGSKKDNFHVGIIQSIRSMDQSNQERKTEDGLDLFLSPTTQRSFSFFFSSRKIYVKNWMKQMKTEKGLSM